MKLVVAIVHGDDAGPTSTALSDAGFAVTRVGTSGGFLQKGNATLLVGVDDGKVDDVIAAVRGQARGRTEYVNPLPHRGEPPELTVPFPVEVEVGGATIFVLDVERYEKT